jgi:hypothetical protein
MPTPQRTNIEQKNPKKATDVCLALSLYNDGTCIRIRNSEERKLTQPQQ